MANYQVIMFMLLIGSTLFFAFPSSEAKRHHHHTNTGKKHPVSTHDSVISLEDYLDFGIDDDTEAFKKAWEKACDTEDGVLEVPDWYYTYKIKQVKLIGPCKTTTTIKLYGTIQASNNMSDYINDRRHWISFEDVDNLTVLGGGTFDGNGKIWWENSCKLNQSKPCLHAPTAVMFYGITNLRIEDITVANAQQMHMVIEKCENVRANNVHISSPEYSPNTDGIHITGSSHVRLHRSNIHAGDDCVSIVTGSRNIMITDTICGPGHGISIGSLGEDNSEAAVSNIFVNRAVLTETMYGVRIKTWQGGYGYAKNIKFQNVEMRNVKNPIIINQNYCDQTTPCEQQRSAVQVSNIKYSNIRGTSHSEVAIKFNCSDTHPCEGIMLHNINLVRLDGSKAKAECRNVNLIATDNVIPSC